MARRKQNAKEKDAVLERLRAICLALPEASEVPSWGHPNFKAGSKMFAAYDEYKGTRCIAFKAERPHQEELVRDARFFAAPYSGNLGWVCLRTDGKLEWKEIEELLLRSYRLVALKRMLAALDAAKPPRR